MMTRPAHQWLAPQAAFGDDADSPIETGLCSKKYVFQCAPTLLLVAPMSALGQSGTKSGDLYLLAGTLVPEGHDAYPVSLYALDARHKLKLVRHIVTGNDTGLYAVRDDMGDKIYVAYPAIIPTTVSVIHKDRPAMNDDVRFNPEGVPVLGTDFVAAAGDGGESTLLCTLLPPIGDRPGHSFISLVSIGGDAPEKGSRIRQGDWSMFRFFRYQGAPGGPLPDTDYLPVGYIADNRVRMRGQPGVPPYTMKLDLSSTPPFPLEDCSDTIFIVIASGRYFAFAPLQGHSLLYVHDRDRNTWKVLTSPSTVPYARRLFGSWLASIVEIWHPGERVENPAGAENERNWASPLLTNVRDAYRYFMDSSRSMPGTLLLDNLEDGRRITLDAGQQDSEILTVRDDGLVLYRVNDSIFAAQINGNQLTKPSLVVKDEDVPEVHWVFWSH